MEVLTILARENTVPSSIDHIRVWCGQMEVKVSYNPERKEWSGMSYKRCKRVRTLRDLCLVREAQRELARYYLRAN